MFFLRSGLGFVLAFLALTAGAQTPGRLAQGDADFLHKAARSGQLEIQASALAQKADASAPVKSFAEKMTADHTKVAVQLEQLAKAKGVTLPTGLDPAQQATLDELGKLRGKEFDRRYAQEVGVAAHKKAVALFEESSKSAADTDVKAFASQTLPALKGHLQMAESLRGQAGS